MWPCLLLICCGALPIFDAHPDNPWDTLRDVFYTHRFTNGQIYEHDVSLDHAPWATWSRFYNDETFNAQVHAALDAFLKQPKEAVEGRPAVRRAVLLRDLWPVFDAQTEGNLFDAPVQEGTAANEVAARRQAELRSGVATVMRRLELSDAEAKALPNNYQAAVDVKLFPATFNPKSPDQGFLPADLFDESGPWVAMVRDRKTIGAQGHLEAVRHRSIFVPYIRVSDKRQETLDYLKAYRRRPSPLPKGTLLALARRMALPATSGHMRATPVLESLQLIVVDPPHDHHYKFALDRASFIAGKPGLRQLSNDEPVDAYSFEAGGLFLRKNEMDADGEMLTLGRYAGPVPKGLTSLGHCIMCHGPTVGSRLFANFGDSHAPSHMSWTDQAKWIIDTKEDSPSWKLYQAERK